MAYRRRAADHTAGRDWQAWVHANGEALAELGLPLGLYSSRIAWDDFLATGNAVVRIGSTSFEFDFNSLSIARQKALLAFLEDEYGEKSPAPGLLGFLRVRARGDWKDSSR